MVFLPEDSIINPAKLTQYLLVQLSKNDKSNFLAQAGYTLENWQQLEQDLRTQVLSQHAEPIEITPYGKKYRIRATLRGQNGIELKILTIWMVNNNQTRFVTLVPDKGEKK
ncbi:hypothetical protein E1H12_16520 [Geitlerinema sp. P-1104]|uniref:DUF6883 domain-containing protein n=1 Tax=Geitlerinema sp. P-1104 TaxID=2546230 RepID=UPI001477225D|nr:DUF6883 domain-containing protein [Geitlerinema sp. P-1104]NMG60074.1 hypothetical protein [Geitlerinema sp. P-1104]